MTRTALHQQFEDLLPCIRQPARLTGGESGSGRGFGAGTDELRVVLGFPETYEIGISNQALQILYSLAGTVKGVAVERTYLPWVDAIAEMRRRGLPLLTLETWSPVTDADLLGVTLQHESNYTNLLEMLDLAGIPLSASARGAGAPLVLAGGPACADFLPVSRFLDAVAVGDGEEVFPEILQVLLSARREGASRTEMKLRLSRIPGVFVPGVSAKVARRVVARLEDAPYPADCLVPLTAGVHDRAWVEVMRGCTRGCRFCQAGMWYRPVRERSSPQVVNMAGAQLAATGHQELAYASLSTTDYTALEEVLQQTAQAYPEVRVSLPSLRVDSAAVRLARLASPTGPSLTLAPEAGSQRMRDIINKNVTEADVLGAAEEAFRGGRTTLKLYFMIGLPHESDEDVAAIADLCLAVRDVGRRILGPRSGRLQLHVSVNNFIPKPFTPFQWAGMADRQTLRRRQEVLRSRLRRPGVRLDLSDVDKSYLEAVLARGGEDLGAVIEAAWRLGARFDSWTEQFRLDAWRQAFAAIGADIETLATTALSPDVSLPWEVVTGSVQKDFLWAEWEEAEQGTTTPDCRWDGCAECGVCTGPVANDLAVGAGAGPGGPGRASSPLSAGLRPPPPRCGLATGRQPPQRESQSLQTGAAEPGSRWRYIARFSVGGRSRFIGHLDRAEILRRSVRKAGGRLALSAGMRPKPLLSLALPLAVGVESRCELAEFELAQAAGPDFATRLAASLPAGMSLLGVETYEGRRSVAARVEAACYEVAVEVRSGASGRTDARALLVEAAGRFAECSTLPVQETREDGVRMVDVRRYVGSVSVAGGGSTESGGVDGGADLGGVGRAGQRSGSSTVATLSFRVAVTPSGSARPERVVDALAALTGVELHIRSVVRTAVHLAS